jgi:hypothetical protein
LCSSTALLPALLLQLKSWMEQVAKEQNEANARQLEQKEYPPETADMLRKPFTAQDVQAKLVNRFSNTGPSKSQQAQGVCLGGVPESGCSMQALSSNGWHLWWSLPR